MKGDRLFWFWTVGTLITYIGFILLVVVACFLYAGVKNIAAAMASEEIRFATRLSLLTATISTFFGLFFGIPVAYALARYQGRFKPFLDSLLDLPIVLPPVAVGVALLVFFSQFPSQESSLDRWLQRIGLAIVYEVPGIVVAQFAIISAYGLRVLKAAFETLNPRLPEVARTLGLSLWNTFFWIELPQAVPSLLAATVLMWARAMGEFGATVLLAGATLMKTEVLSIAIFLAMQQAAVDKALAAAVVLVLVSIAALVAFRYLTQRAF